MKLKKSLNKKVEIPVKRLVEASIIISIVVTLLCATIIYAATPSTTFYISSGVYPGAPSYTIWVEDSNYFAKDANGQLKYSGTNASEVINNALSNGGKIFLKNATYYLDSRLEIVEEGTTIEGEGKDTVLYLEDNSDCDVIYCNGAGWEWGITLQNFKIHGNADGQTAGCTSHAINIRWVHRVHISNIIVYKAYNRSIDLWQAYYPTVTNCISIRSGASAIHIYGGTIHGVVQGNIIQEASTITDATHGISCGAFSYGAIVGNTVLYGAHNGDGINTFSASCHNTVTGNVVTHAGAFGDCIVVDGVVADSAYNVVSDNDCYGAPGRGIYILDASNNLIDGNLVRNAKYGIGLESANTLCENNTVSNNMVLNSTTYGIRETQSGAGATDDNYIAHNTLRDNPTQIIQEGGAGANSVIEYNFGYYTEKSGTAEASNTDAISFGVTFAGTPTTVVITVNENDARYIAQAYSITTTQFSLLLYDDTAGADETVDKTISWYAEYRP